MKFIWKKNIWAYMWGILIVACLWFAWRARSIEHVDSHSPPSNDSGLKPIAEKASILSHGTSGGSSSSEVQNRIEAVVRGLFGNPETKNPYTTWSVHDLIAALESGQGDMKEHQKMLWALCYSDDPLAVGFLSDFVTDESREEHLRASALEGLAVEGRGQGYDLAIEALETGSDVVARGAIRALSRYGGDEAVDILSQLAFDFENDPTVSLAAAEALGDEGSAEAADALVELFEHGVLEGRNDALEFALLGLGKIEIPEMEQYLAEIYKLASDPEIRVLVLEGLEEAEGNTSEIIKLAMVDENKNVRAAAAWDLAYSDETTLTTDELMAFMNGETDAEVRRNLYLALDNQDGLDMDHMMAMVRQETYPSAQLAGYQLMCRQLMNIPDEAYAEFSGNMRRGLMELRNEGSVSLQEMDVIDRIIDRIDKGSIK